MAQTPVRQLECTPLKSTKFSRRFNLTGTGLHRSDSQHSSDSGLQTPSTRHSSVRKSHDDDSQWIWPPQGLGPLEQVLIQGQEDPDFLFEKMDAEQLSVLETSIGIWTETLTDLL